MISLKINFQIPRFVTSMPQARHRFAGGKPYKTLNWRKKGMVIKMKNMKLEKCLSEYNDIIKENDNIYRDTVKKFGLSECAFWILYVLRTGSGKITQTDICESLYQPKQTVNSALKKLEDDGLIELIYDGDHRSKRIKLTAKGVFFSEKTADKVIMAEHKAIDGLTESEQRQFITLFHKYTDLLRLHLSDI